MMIGYTVPEIRRLLAALFVRRHQAKTFGGGHAGDDDVNTKPASATTNAAATHSGEVPLQY